MGPAHDAGAVTTHVTVMVRILSIQTCRVTILVHKIIINKSIKPLCFMHP